MNDVRPSSRRATVVAVAILIATALAPWGRAQTPSAAPQAAAPPAATPGAKRAFEPADWYKLKTITAPAMSPDGKYVAVQVTSVVEAKNARMSEIWVVATAPDGGTPVRFSAPGFDSTAPRFSPDSTHVIYTSTRPGYTTTQWAVRVDRPGGESPYTAAAEGPAEADTSGGEFSGRQGGPGQGPASSQPADKSFTVYTGVESAGGNRGGGARPRQRPERSLREDAADGQTAGERGHAAARSDAVRRHADHRHALQGQRPRLRPEHRRAGRTRRRSRPRRSRACRRPAADADSRRPARRRRTQGDHELDLLAPRRDRLARWQVDRLRRRRRPSSRSRTAEGPRRDRSSSGPTRRAPPRRASGCSRISS